MRHLAPLIRAAQASLRAGLATRIADWNEDADNQVTLPEIADQDIHFGPMPGWAGWRLPAIEVAIPEATLDAFAIGQAAHSLKGPGIVTAWVEGDAGDAAMLYELALGYSACILDVMAQPDAWGDGVVLERVECAYPAFNPRPDEREPSGFRVLALHVFAFDEEDARTA